jgi:uncharacterized protein RhaS with RHS repeats
MQLGALLSRFDDEAVVLETLVALEDLTLMSRVQSAAEQTGTDVGAWASDAVGRFIASADDTQWLGLMTACTNAPDPGLAALKRMLEVTLEKDKPARC